MRKKYGHHTESPLCRPFISSFLKRASLNINRVKRKVKSTHKTNMPIPGKYHKNHESGKHPLRSTTIDTTINLHKKSSGCGNPRHVDFTGKGFEVHVMVRSQKRWKKTRKWTY